MTSPAARSIQLFLVGIVSLMALPAQEATKKGAAEDRNAVLARQSVIYEQSNLTVTFQNDGRWQEEEYRRARVASEEGVREMGKLRFGFGADNQKVEILTARVIKKDGKVVEAGPDSILEVAEPFAGFGNEYSDYREKHILVPGLQTGDTVEYRVRTVEERPLAPGHFWYAHFFESNRPCLSEVLKIVVPSAREIRLRYKPKHVPAIKDEAGWTSYEWRSSHIPPDEPEAEEKKPDKQSRKERQEDARPDVQLTTFPNWEAVASWYRPLQESRMRVTRELREKTQELTRDCKTDIEKVQAIYSFVATRVRYMSLSFGIGRIRPHLAADVLEHLYGDCKDKHTLLATMLKIAGFDACPVLTSVSGELDDDQPSPSRLDHVLTLVHLGDSQVWLDTTSETAPFRVVAAMLRKKPALIVHLDGSSSFTKIPANPPFEFSTTLDIDAVLAENGTITGKVNYTVRGEEELALRGMFRSRPPSDWKKVANFVHDRLTLPGEVTTVTASDPLDTRQAFRLEYEFSGLLVISPQARPRDTLARLPLPQLDTPWFIIDDAPDPEPIDLGYPVKKTGRLRLKLPPGFLDRPPLPVSVKRDYGEYESKYELSADTLIAERRLEIRLSEIDGKRSREHASFEQAVQADGAQQLLLKDDFLKKRLMAEKKDVERLLQSGLGALEGRDFQTAIQLLKQVVDMEPDHPSAWSSLGRCYSALAQWETAIEKYRKQIAINPYDDNCYNSLGWACAELGRYSEAEEAYRKQIEINPLHGWAHRNLGFFMMQQEKYAEALPELEKAASILPNELIIKERIGSVLFHLGRPEEGAQAFEKVLQTAPNPLFWNDAAYTMAEFGFRLDLAEQYALSAVQGTRTALLNVPTAGKFCCPLVIESISTYWDTLGFIHMQKGDYANAERYVSASWELGQHGECGAHLGEIYLNQGDKQRAAAQFARSLAAYQPPVKLRKRLADLVGAEKVDDLVTAAGAELIKMRTIEVTPALPGIAEDIKADFIITLSSAAASEVRFLSGDEKLRAYEDQLKKLRFPFPTPDDQPIRIFRRGELKCFAAEGGACRMLLELPRNVRSLEGTPTQPQKAAPSS